MHFTDAAMSSSLKFGPQSRMLGGSHGLNQARKLGPCWQREIEKKETS